MRVVFDAAAADDLDEIHAWITQDRPAEADSVVTRILTAIERLGHFPHIGHPGGVPDTYEWVVVGLPYIVVYELAPERDELIVIDYRSLPRRPTTPAAIGNEAGRHVLPAAAGPLR